MLLPRFSTRVVLIVTALCAVYFLMVGLGMRGALWAAGVAIATTSVLFMAVVHAALFGLCYVVGQAFMRKTATASAHRFSGATRHDGTAPTGPDRSSASHAEVPEEEIRT